MFADPDRFNLERKNARLQLGFALEPHLCIGMHLARNEALVAAQRLFAWLPGLRLDPERESAPAGLVFASRSGLIRVGLIASKERF